MQLISRRLLLGFYLLVVAAFAPPAFAQEFDAADFWTAAEVSGTVFVRAGDNEWSESVRLSPGQRIGPFSRVQASANSEAILVRRGDRITVYANAEIELPGSDRASGISRIFQRAGEVLFRVRKRSNQDFEVATPYLVAGVRGTTFAITATDATSQLHVVEGAVAVGSAGDAGGPTTLVRALETATAGVGLSTSLSPATIPAIEAWDDRTFDQAEQIDAVIDASPDPLQRLWAPLSQTAAGQTAPDLKREIQDVALRLSTREAEAVQRAEREPTARNRAIAETARASAVRLASLGVGLPAPTDLPAPIDSDVERTTLPAPTVTPVAPPVPARPAPAVQPSATTAPQPLAAPTVVTPRPVQPAAAPRVIVPAPAAPNTPNATGPVNAATQAAPGTAPGAEQIIPDADGVVYSTLGIEETDDGLEVGTDGDAGSVPAGLNIEGLGAAE